MRILVCGSRKWTDREIIHDVLLRLPCNTDTVIIHGGCRGADKISAEIAKELGMTPLPFPADWSRGPSGGPKRNAKMLAEGNPDRVIAFHDDWSDSKGTYDMITRARAAGLDVTLISHCSPDMVSEHKFRWVQSTFV